MPAPTSKRSLEFAWLTLAGIPGDVWCLMNHICKDGHLYHKEMPKYWLYYDFIWAAALVAAAISVLHSDVKRRLFPFGLLLFLVLSRLLIASSGGGMEIIEMPVLVYLAVLAGLTILRVRRQRREQSTASQT
ncbi:MAG: hypothetical protein NTZ16_06395 [Verrucomicrobia bacterium]|nr:hypothetical protein [Verrucomicrobiota bacterium]